MKSARFAEALRLLAKHDVQFIVVGMMAGVLAGAPVTTLDVDIVHLRTEANVAKLLEVLRQLEATYRLDSRGLVPTTAHLMGPGHQLLATLYGDLDCLGTIDEGKAYEDLLPSTREIALSADVAIRVLDLPTLIAIKRRTARPKDLAVLPLLEATLDETKRRS